MGDQILSKSEDDVDGAVRVQTIEMVFQRVGKILEINIGGQTIETTPEHPFYVRDAGWTDGGDLKAGDELLGTNDCWTPIDAITLTAQEQTVYNIHVSNDHTYFVGDADWNFSVWVHNAHSVGNSEWLQKWEGEGIGNSRGHIIANHVGKDSPFLISRLKNVRKSSTFPSQSVAESVIGSTIRQNRSKLKLWLKTATKGKRLALDYSGSTVIGRSFIRGDIIPHNLTNARTILQSLGKGKYHILTAFPK